MYRGKRCMMSVFVHTCGQPALCENSCGELVRLFAWVQPEKSRQNFKATLRCFVIASRRLVHDDFRNEGHMLRTVVDPPISSNRLMPRRCRISAQPACEVTDDRRLEVKRGRLRCETRRRKQREACVLAQRQPAQPRSQLGDFVLGCRNREGFEGVPAFHVRTLSGTIARRIGLSWCFRAEMRRM